MMRRRYVLPDVYTGNQKYKKMKENEEKRKRYSVFSFQEGELMFVVESVKGRWLQGPSCSNDYS